MMNVFVLLIIFSCQRPDYQLLEPDRSNRGADEPEMIVESFHLDNNPLILEEESFEDNQQIHPDDIQPNMRLDAALQHMGWGETLTRCQIEVAFNRRLFAPPDEDSHQPPPPDPPSEPGECVFFSRERPEEGSSNPQQDNWFISGDISGPSELYLHSIEQTIVLELVRAEDGLVRYEMENCRQETFPFGEVFDLEIPYSDGQYAVPASYIEEVLTFGPNIRIETPETDHRHHQLQGYASDGLYFSWSFDDSVSDLVEEQMIVRLTNNSNRPWNYDEGIGEGESLIPQSLYEYQLSRRLTDSD